jgi:hypothetical protein
MTSVKRCVVTDVPVNTINSIQIRVKCVKTRFETYDKEYYEASANAKGKPDDINYRIKFISFKMPPGGLKIRSNH